MEDMVWYGDCCWRVDLKDGRGISVEDLQQKGSIERLL